MLMPSTENSADMERVPRIRLPYHAPVIREDFLIDLCRGKKVLHVGCTDYPYTQQKHASGLLLHERLRPNCARLVGIDLDSASIAWLSQQGIPDLYVADATRLSGFLEGLNFEPELVIAGEVVEHLSCPGDFLQGIRRAMTSKAQLVITVPNAFAYFGIVQMLLGREKVHPDHVAYYSYGTLRELLRRHGFEAEQIIPCKNREMRTLDKILHAPFHAMLRLLPHFSNGYLAIARPSPT
jgi:predicted TPR repeat methyltransferase